MSHRREFLRICLGGTAGLCVLQGDASLQTAKLDSGLSVISGAGANVLVAATPDGVAMVDGGLPERSAELLELAGDPVKLLFNTNWHLEHTGSNEHLGKAGVKIVAHANTRKWLRTRVFVEMQNRTYTARPPEAMPNETFYEAGKTSFGKVPIEYGHLPFGTSDGDIYVFFPESNVMVVSDILTVGRYPFMDYNTGGWIGGMVEATNVLLTMVDTKTRIVPGLGPVQSKQDLEAQHDMVTTVGGRVLDMVQQGKGFSEIVAAKPTSEFDAQWGQPDQFVTMTYRGIMRNLHDVNVIRSR